MNEVVPDAVDVRVHHQRINEAENQHHPKRGVRIEEEEADKIGEMKQARQRGNHVPAGVRENLRVGRRAFDADGVSGGHTERLANLNRERKPFSQVLMIANAMRARLT